MKNPNIEAARVIAIVAVVTLHTKASGVFGDAYNFGFVSDELARFAVPLFFIFSGFLWKEDIFSRPTFFLKRLGRRVLVPFVCWVMIYLAADQSGFFHAPKDLHSLGAWVSVALAGLPAYHLWFLPALWFGAALVICCHNFFGLRPTFFLALISFLFGAVIGFYSQALGFHPPSFYYRNGLSFAPIFILTGYLMQTSKLSIGFSVLCVVLGASGQIFEGYFIGTYPNGQDFSASTLVFAIGVAGCVFAIKARTPRFISSLGRHAFTAYLLHLLILWFYIAIVPFEGISAGLLCIAVVSTLSIALAALFDEVAVVAKHMVYRWAR